MNKLFTKIVGVCLGLTMAVGVGVAVAGGSKEVGRVDAANSVTVTSEFSDKDWKTTAASDFGWTATKSGNSKEARGVQVLGKSDVVVTADTSYDDITSVSIWLSKSNKGVGSVALKVGTTTVKTQSSFNTSATQYTASSLTLSGVVSFTVTCTTSSIYVQKVSITYTESEPEVDDWELTTGSLTIETNPTITRYYSDDDSSDINLDGASIKANYWSASDHSITKSEGVTNDVTATLNLENESINLSYSDGGKIQTGSIAITVDSGTRPLYEEISTFDSISGTIDTHISYEAAQGSAGTAPAVYNSEIRVYQDGGLFTVSSDEDTRIVEIILGSSMATTVTYSVDGGEASSSKSISGGGKLTVDSLEASSVQFTCTGTDKYSRLYVNFLKVTYKEVEKVVPTKAVVSFNSGKGTYYNGDRTTTNTFSTEDITIVTYDANDNLAKSYGSGIGYKVTINGNTLDATSEVKTLSFAGVTANSYAISVVVEGVGADGANVDNSTQSPAVSLTVVAKTPESYEWTAAQTTVFYSHRDTFAIDGTLKCTFNDTAYTAGMSNYSHVIRAYDGSAANHAGSETTLPVHNDGTLNVSSETTYVLDMWHKDYSSGLHCYTEFTVKVPTLTISDNYKGTYYVGVERALNVNVVATFEDAQHTQTLSSSEYELRIGGNVVTSVTPANTNSINVTATWIIDGNDALTTASPLVINPEVSTRELNEIAVSDQTLSAGSYFVLSNGAITLDVTEGGVDDLEGLSQNQVTITKGAKTYTSSDRIKKSDAGTYTVTYSEGVGNEVSCTFTLTVTDAVVSSISSTTSNVYNKITSTDDLSSGSKYLVVCEGKGVALNGTSDTITGNNDTSVSISNDKIVGTNTLDAAVVTITAKDGGYSMATQGGTYLGHSGSSNSLNTSASDTFTITIAFDDDGNANIGCNSRVLRRNNSSDQFRYYTQGQTAIQLYKQAEETVYTGSKVGYLESVIDAYRLNSGTEGSVCNADSGLYSSADWTTAKGVYAQLTSEELSEFSSTQDYFGEEGKTYNDTFLMLLSKDPAVINQSSRGVFDLLSGGALSKDSVIVIVSLVSLTAIGGYFFLRKRKEN